jgi:hypothetical protein
MALGLILVIIPFMLAQPEAWLALLLMLNKGKWETRQYLMRTIALPLHTSQNINLGYGYLW